MQSFISYLSPTTFRPSTTRLVCAFCFMAFSFVWLYAFQADMLTVAQHALSGGVTHYNRTIGATLITLALQLLQLLVFTVTRLARRTHALTYLPSFLVLAIISSHIASAGQVSSQPSFANVAIYSFIILVLWTGAVWLSRQLLPFDKDNKVSTHLFSKRTWVSLFQMACMMIAVAAISNTNAVNHFKAHAETSLLSGDTHEALRVGAKSHETDPHLTMLRAYALSRQNEMGERLFCYAIKGTSDNLLPSANTLLILPADSIWKHLGGRPKYKLTAEQYYQALEKDSLATKAVADYRLCGKLIDRDLRGFAQMIADYYPTDNLPRHYREALVLYQHLTNKSAIEFSDDALEKEWNEFQQIKNTCADPSERMTKIMDKYKNNYWYYYEYGNK